MKRGVPRTVAAGLSGKISATQAAFDSQVAQT
jgi:hypothetical protein